MGDSFLPCKFIVFFLFKFLGLLYLDFLSTSLDLWNMDYGHWATTWWFCHMCNLWVWFRSYIQLWSWLLKMWFVTTSWSVVVICSKNEMVIWVICSIFWICNVIGHMFHFGIHDSYVVTYILCLKSYVVPYKR